MRQKTISLLLCAVLLMTVCVPGALGFQAWGEETEPPTFTTEEPTVPEETEPAPTDPEPAPSDPEADPIGPEADPADPEADPADPEAPPTEEAEPTEAPVCPSCGQAEGHTEDCPEFVPEETEDPFDPEEAKAVLLAAGSVEEIEAFLSGLTEEQAHALIRLLTEEEIHALLTRLGIPLGEVWITPPRNYTRVGPLMPPVNVSPRLMTVPRAEEPENGLILSKNAERIPGTDTYRITMEAYTTGEVTSSDRSVPADIVLVLDESRSMTDRIAEYTKVYELDQGKSYYVKQRNSYVQVKWCEAPFSWLAWHNGGWYSGTHTTINHILGSRYEPMTSQDDETPGHVQFYERGDGRESKNAILKRVATSFADQVKADADANSVDHRISVIGFSDSSNIKIGLADDIRNNLGDVQDAIGNLGADGGTYIEQGMASAINVFNNAAPPAMSPRSRVVIVFTDGIPGSGSWNNTTINGSANPAIASAYTLKNQYGATVYSIGMLEDANPELPISDEANNSARTNKFLHYLSSNYPNATSMTDGGSGGDRGYYLSASDTGSLDYIFRKISQEIATPTISLGSQTQIRDIVSPCFTMPAGTEAIHLYTADYNGSSFVERVPLTDADVSLDESTRTVTVTGFDFNANFVSKTPKDDGTYGKKLIIEFVVSTRNDFLGGNRVPTNGEGSAVYDKDGVPVESFPYPSVDVKPNGSFSCKDQSIYLSQTPDLEALLVETVDPDGENNAFVNIIYTLYDDTGKKLATKVIPAGQTEGAWVWEPGAEQYPLLTDDHKYALSCEVAPIYDGTYESLALNDLTPWVYVFKPELTYRDSFACYGDDAPTDFAWNLTTTLWKHGDAEADVTVMGQPPVLNITYTPEEAAILDGKIAVKRDIPVKASVKIGEMDAMAYTVFRHTPCDPACGWEDPAEKGNPAFLIHVALCQLTVTKNGGEAGETFIMDLYRNGALYTQVTVGPDSSVTIGELPVGTYSIRENESWAWRYESSVSGSVILSQSNHRGTITCANKRINDQWLGHSAAARNVCGDGNQ